MLNNQGEAIMQIFFLHHSAVCVVMDEALLVFDYFMGNLGDGMASGSISDEEIKSAKRVYVFVSHSHGDHFSRIIFDWEKLNRNVTYLVDDTVSYPEIAAIVNTTAASVAAGDHGHEDIYYTKSDFITGTAIIDWSKLSGVPAGLADGDDDSLAGLACADDEILRRVGSAWVCDADRDSEPDQ